MKEDSKNQFLAYYYSDTLQVHFSKKVFKKLKYSWCTILDKLQVYNIVVCSF